MFSSRFCNVGKHLERRLHDVLDEAKVSGPSLLGKTSCMMSRRKMLHLNRIKTCDKREFQVTIQEEVAVDLFTVKQTCFGESN